jgi:uncharacterized membrane protein YraQ (UPF0718 family)
VADSVTVPDPAMRARSSLVLVGVLATVLLAVVSLMWAKWLPYQARVRELSGSRAWTGTSILDAGGVRAGDTPSWHAATTFTVAYGKAVWRALVAALLISAAVQTLVPRAWLLRVLNRPGRLSGALAGGLASTPSMMCACCAAPVAVSMRRSGVSTAAVVAYWLGNPLLNPAVLVFLLLVAPWQWGATRLIVGGLVVVAGAALVARLTDGRVPAAAAADLTAADLTEDDLRADGPATAQHQGRGQADPPASRQAWQLLTRYGRTLLRLCLTLVPEYLVVVMLIGGLRGWILSLSGDAIGSGVLVVLVAAVVGTVLVIPTAGEIPILQGLAIAGLSLGAVGALLVTLPAVSLPGIAMVVRTFGWRVTATTAAVVVTGGALAAGLLVAW